MHLARLSAFALALCCSALAFAQSTPADPRLSKAWRFERAHWIYLHLEGSPSDIGFQHGYLLAPEIEDAFKADKTVQTHNTKRDWQFYRDTAKNVLWPNIEDEYRQELQGITDGLKAKGIAMDLWDVVAFNGKEEISDYYVPMLDRQQKRADAPRLVAPGNCSAFVATGAWTRDHKPVIAHNNWTTVVSGERWRIMYDIVPTHGYRLIMDGYPGIIVSDDDFSINAAGLAVTETTITGFRGYDPAGKPEFVRARKAMQYADSIDKFESIMLDGNNGGYANDWLLADYRTGEVARFELGLKVHRLWRSKDGYFVGSNFPSDPELIAKETDFDVNNQSSSPNARHKRWDELMASNKGKLNADVAQKLLADHFDSFQQKEEMNERGLCGHVNRSPRGIPEWEWKAYEPAGAVNAKASDATLAGKLALRARAGFPCGADFIAAEFLKQHPEFSWEKEVLQDMKGNPWAEFKAGDKQ